MHHFISLSAKEAAAKLRQFGFNEIKDIHKVSAFDVLLRQVKKNSIIYLLSVAAIISFFISKPLTSYAIFFVIFLVIIIGFIQEFRAEKAIQALKEMLMPTSLAIRDGKEVSIPSKELVPGDIIILRNGEKIPADCQVIEETELTVNESILTGESREIEKKIHDLLFMGSYIAQGKCFARVVETGMNTKFGKIAKMISTAEKELPLQTKINHISKYMVTAAFGVSILTGILILSRTPVITVETVVSIFVLVIAFSVSSFPEGFPVVLITTLSIGAKRMAKKNALVNRISIIESLGETTVICADKTGTITKGEMTAKKVFAGGTIYEITGTGFEAEGSFIYKDHQIDIKNHNLLQKLLLVAVLCNDARIEKTKEGKEYRISGSSTEGALLIMAAKAGIFSQDFKFIKEEETLFNSKRKMMSVLGKLDTQNLVFAKGAPEVLLQKCNSLQLANQTIALNNKEKELILGKNTEITKEGFRTLALAYKPADSGSKRYSENNLIFLGLVALEDPPREEVAFSIKTCQQAGIEVKMITGDNKETAQAIAQQIGLNGEILEGYQLDKLSDEDLFKVINTIAIFARVNPEHKLRIVKVLKAQGEIVTMTGDGVNDAPALKEAHIGVAMGINGTDVARSVADLTLRDNNFATIVYAIKEGRTIFSNIRKLVTYELSCNFAELITIFVGVILAVYLGWQTPIFLALQILFMNLVTDNLPSLTMGFNPASADIMREKPRRNQEILNKNLFSLVLFSGSLMALITLAAYYLTFNIFGQSTEVARTTALATLILLEIANAFNFRSFRYKSLTRSPLTNKPLFYASIISIVATIFIIYSSANKLFDATPIALPNWILAMASALIFILIFDVLKELRNKFRKLPQLN